MALLKVLAFDPGQKHFATSVVSYSTSSNTSFQAQKLKVLATGLIPSTITALVVKRPGVLDDQSFLFLEILKTLVDQYQPTHVIAERYMTRGMGGGGNTTEVINLLLGMLLGAHLTDKHLNLIGASTWKNEVKRQRAKQGYDEKIYKHSCNKTETYKGFEVPKGQTPISAHQVDASLIAAWAVHKLIRVKPFDEFDFEDYFAKVKAAKVITF
jgi:hypothetical protein